MEEHEVQILKELFLHLRSIKALWEKQSADETPIDVWRIQTAEEDCADTDLYMCSIRKENVSICRYTVLVKPNTKVIELIDLNDVDIMINGVLYEDIDLEDEKFWDSIYTLA